MIRRRGRGVAVAMIILLVASACSGGGGGSAAKNSSNSSSSAANSSSSSTDDNSVGAGKSEFGPNDDDAIIEKAVGDVQSFYEKVFPQLYGGSFAPVSGGLFPYGPNNPPPKCGGVGKSDYAEVAQNAFYCPESDFVAWDTDNLTNDLLDNFGPFTLAIVVAHELGHAIQARHGILDGRFVTFLTEQQADCFAGAYTRNVQDGGSTAFKVTLADLDNALGGFLLIRDPVGTDTVNDVSAHGSAFQRINAFEDGLKEGPDKCKSYEDGALNFVPEVFDPGSLDEANQGNLPFPEVEPLAIANLEAFWTRAFADINKTWTTAKTDAFDPADGVSCAGQTKKGKDAVGVAFYCAADDTLNWDEKRLMPAVYKIGDLAEAMVIATQYSERAQTLAGLPTNSLDSRLQVDCFTGVWVGTLSPTGEINKTLPDNAAMSLSPGDLDEVVSAFLEFNKSASDEARKTSGSAFQHVDAFRSGFFTSFNNGFNQGLTDCVNNSGAVAASSDSTSS